MSIAHDLAACKQRVEQVLLIMLTAWASAQLQQEAENLLANLSLEGD